MNSAESLIATAPSIIETKDLVKRRGSFTLGPLNLHIPGGFVTGLIGANGSGKTTTLRTLVGLMPADSGSISIPAIENIGIAYDQPFLVPDWRIKDAASAYSSFRPGWDPLFFNQLCKRFNLHGSSKVKDLSRGEGSKLMIALALGNHPELLILDEPTSGLDPSSRADLIDLLREQMEAPDTTLLFSTHITSDLENFADHLVFIDQGKIIYSGTIDDLEQDLAYVHGPLKDLSSANKPLVFGLRHSRDLFDGVIRLHDSAAFGPSIQIEKPTIEQVAVHLRSPQKAEK